MNKFYSKLLLGAVSGLSLMITGQAVKAEPAKIENLCDYPLYKEYPLVQEEDCSAPADKRVEPTGSYTS